MSILPAPLKFLIMGNFQFKIIYCVNLEFQELKPEMVLEYFASECGTMGKNRAQLARRRMRQQLSVLWCPALINYRQRWIIFKRENRDDVFEKTHTVHLSARSTIQKRGAIAYLRSPIIKTRAPSYDARVRARPRWPRGVLFIQFCPSHLTRSGTQAPIDAAPSLENN